MLCALMHRTSGVYCTRDVNERNYHAGAHVAEDIRGVVLKRWNRLVDDCEQPRYRAEAERQLGLRTVAKPGNPDYKP